MAVLLAVSILGLPLGLALLLGSGLVFLLGLAAAAVGIGRTILPPPRSRVGAALAGWGLLALVGLVPVLNGVAWGLASVFGVGIGIVAAWRARGTRNHRLGGVAPPPESVPPG